MNRTRERLTLKRLLATLTLAALCCLPSVAQTPVTVIIERAPA